MHPAGEDLRPQVGPLIVARGLVKDYGSTQAVRGISFEVTRGQVVGFLGPNGAGKSTTMKMLTGFLRPSAGIAEINGVDVARDGLAARAKLGYLPENAPLYDDMMVVDFLRFVGEVRELEAKMLRRQLKHVVERCGLGDVLGKDIGELSKGYRQRVGLAQALLHDPDLLILDEPTSGLDPNQIVEIRALIRDLGQDKTVLLSTHILSEVQAVCNRAIIINQGQLVADDTPEALGRGDGAREVVLGLRARDKATLDATFVQARIGALAGVAHVDTKALGEQAVEAKIRSQGVSDVREALFDAAVQNGWIVVEMRQQEHSLEEVFQRLTRGQKAAQGERHAA